MADWNPRANAVFLEAVALPAADRPAFLDRECGADAALRNEVEALLQAHAEAGSFLDAPHPDADATRPADDAPTYTLDRTPDRTLTGDAATAPVVLPDDTPPGYEILRPLGVGGMGVVYLARQLAAKREVALKMIRSAAHATAAERARFRAEAEAAARLQHPGIVAVYEVGEHRGQPFFTLELCDGGSLADKLDGTPWPVAPAARLVEMVADAVHAAHQAGIVHRDLKPANVLIARLTDSAGTVRGRDRGPLLYSALRAPHGAVPKVTDFGISKRTDSPDGPTATGAVLGTPSYMAPEQASGDSKGVGPTADVWAMGAILYELITGRPPFKAATVLDTLEQVRTSEPVAARALNPAAPRDLETVAHKCLQKDPAKRYPSAAALADDLRRFQEGRPITARPVGAVERAWRWCRRNPAVATLAAAVAVALVAGALVSTSFGLQARDEAAKALAAKKDADDNAELAKKNEATANDNAATANAATDRARQLLQAVHVRQASDSLGDRKMSRVATAMAAAMPAPGEPDLRGWEWHCLDRLTGPDEETPAPFLAARGAPLARRVSADGTRVGLLYQSEGQPAHGSRGRGKHRFEVWDIAARPAKRLSSADLEEPTQMRVSQWKIAADLTHVGVVHLYLTKNQESRGYTANVYDTTGTRLPLPLIEDNGGTVVDLIGVAADGGAVEVYVMPMYDELPPDTPLESHQRTRLYRWEKGSDKWKRVEVHAPVWKDGKKPDEFAFLLAESVRGDSALPTLSGRRLFVSQRYRPTAENQQPVMEAVRWDVFDTTADPPKSVCAVELPADQFGDVVLSPNGQTVAVRTATTLKVCQATADLPVVWQAPHSGTDTRDGRLVAVSDDGGRVMAYEGALVDGFRVYTRPSPDGKVPLREVEILSRFPMTGLHLQFTPGGARLTAIGRDRVLAWDLTREREYATDHSGTPLPASAWTQPPGISVTSLQNGPASSGYLLRDTASGNESRVTAPAGSLVGAVTHGGPPDTPRTLVPFTRKGVIGTTAVPTRMCGGWRLLDRGKGFAEVASADPLPETATAVWSFHGGLLVGHVRELVLDERNLPGNRGFKGPFFQVLRSELRVHDSRDGRLLCRIPLAQKTPESWEELPRLVSVVADPTGRRLLVRTFAGSQHEEQQAVRPAQQEAAERHVIRLFETATGHQLWERKAFFLHPAGPDRQSLLAPPTFSPDGEMIAVWSTGLELNTVLRLVRTADGDEVRRVEGSWDTPPPSYHLSPTHLLFSTDGSTLFASCQGQVKVWDTTSGRLLFRVPPGDTGTRGLTVSDDGRLLFVHEHGSVIRDDARKTEEISRVHVWDTRLGQRLLTLADPRHTALPKGETPTPQTLRFRGGRLEWLTPAGIRVYDGTPRPDR